MNNDELIAAGHELAKCLDSSTPLLDIAKLLSKMATQLDVTTAALREKTKQCEALAAENAAQREFIATCFHAAGDGGDMDGADIQELGERLGLFGRETYQPVIHGYICGHEPGEDSVYVMNKTPATDAFLRKVRAEAILFASYHLPDGGKYQDSIQALAQEVLDGYTQVSFPVQQQRQGGAA
ncbi:hypothetical protein ACT0XK_004098 [Cronobacter sakazakii]|uniref:hypothetical protein n=1 Tax=Cronobacter sakazakii TaxID=28141 RepID=UPI000A0F8762|nr:hypothetical protein [Cronobacter sakazakii]EJK9926564.1 hypothetical protein [Cronobacter sakazakii]EKY1902670.1 hypothetical protein [Cronobacter sakazakii]EKY1907341.1 hypothetical protein [Cronobacter sakazakii]EKY1909892.1 hypothetical protein [Cronobacter sakazakii]EKY1914020.1 hypothetical protein [Cronobacter sakazakii]